MNDTTKKARELYASELRKNPNYLEPAIDDDGEKCKSFATYMVEQAESGRLDGSAEMRAIIAALSEKEQAGQVPVEFDEAVAVELARVSHAQYDSHEICKHFAGELRKRLFYTAPAAGAVPDAWQCEPSSITEIIAAAEELDEELDGPAIASRLRRAISAYRKDVTRKPSRHVAEVVGNDASRHLHWNVEVRAFNYPVGTKLYAAIDAAMLAASKEGDNA